MVLHRGTGAGGVTTDQAAIDLGERIAAAGRELFALHDRGDESVQTPNKGLVITSHVERGGSDVEEPDLAKFRAAVLGVVEPTGFDQEGQGAPPVLRRGVERSPLGISLVAPGGEITIVNPALCEMLGRTESAFREMTLTDVSHPDDLAADRAATASLLAGEIHSYQTERRYLRPDGQVVWALASVLLVRDANGDPDYFFVLVQDISDRHRAEEEARGRAMRWSALADLGHSALSGTTVPSLMDQAVEVVAEMLGLECVLLFTPQPSGALEAVASVGCDRPPAASEHAQFALDLGQPLVVPDLQLERRFGLSPHVMASGFVSSLSVVVMVQGRPHGVLIAYSTERRQFSAEEVNFAQTVSEVVATAIERLRYDEGQHRGHQQERLAAVGQLAAGVAHDFNNIVSAISLYAELIEGRQGLDSAGQGYLSAIRQQVDRGAQLVWQVLDFAHRVPLDRVEVDLVSFVNGLLPLLRRTLPTEVSVVVRADGGPCVARADPTRLQQILMNLVSNARDAIDGTGELAITISCGESSSANAFAGPWVRMEVADTGRGIPPEIVEQVFDPFFTTKPPGQGTGLGLSQVHGLVAQHEGHVEIDSSATGTTVSVTLRAASPVAPSKRLRDTEVPRGSGERLLVVDDDAAVRHPLGQILESLGYVVTLVADGEEAVAVLEGKAAELSAVVSDVLMPGMGGEGLARVIADRWPALPLILVSGSPLVPSQAVAKPAQTPAGESFEGGLIRLAKPFSSAELAETVRLALRRSA